MKLKDIKKEVKEREAKKALSLYKQGYSLREIGKIMGYSYETIRNRIKLLLTTLDK